MSSHYSLISLHDDVNISFDKIPESSESMDFGPGFVNPYTCSESREEELFVFDEDLASHRHIDELPEWIFVSNEKLWKRYGGYEGMNHNNEGPHSEPIPSIAAKLLVETGHIFTRHLQRRESPNTTISSSFYDTSASETLTEAGTLTGGLETASAKSSPDVDSSMYSSSVEESSETSSDFESSVDYSSGHSSSYRSSMGSSSSGNSSSGNSSSYESSSGHSSSGNSSSGNSSSEVESSVDFSSEVESSVESSSVIDTSSELSA